MYKKKIIYSKTKYFIVPLLFLLSLNVHGQFKCKNGFRKTKLNELKVKLPCIYYDKAEGITFNIDSHYSPSDSSYILDMLFHNPTKSMKSIYWYHFKEANSIPLSFYITVEEKNGKRILHKFHPSYYMDNSVYFGRKFINDELFINKYQTLKKTVNLHWFGIKPGVYFISLSYGISEKSLTSNKLEIEIK